MTQNTPQASRLVIVGANHRSSSLDVREKLRMDGESLSSLYGDLAAAGIDAPVVIATNDRLEVLALDDDPEGMKAKVLGVLSGYAGITVAELSGQIFIFSGGEALRHIFSLAVGLDSIVPGNLRVAGRIRDCLEVARNHGKADDELTGMVETALATADRVARETELGSRPGSMATAAEQVVHDLYGDPGGCTGLLIGTGDMGELLGNHLHQAGLRTIFVSGGEPTRQERIAGNLGGAIVPLDDLSGSMAKADIIITCLGSRGRFIDPALVEEALHARRNKPIFLIDAALPGDVEPSVDLMENVFLYDLNDLEQMVMASRAESEAAIKAAWNIVDEDLTAYGGVEHAETPQAVVSRIKARLNFAMDETVRELSASGAPSALIEACRRQLQEETAAILETTETALARGDRQWIASFLSRLFGADGQSGKGT